MRQRHAGDHAFVVASSTVVAASLFACSDSSSTALPADDASVAPDSSGKDASVAKDSSASPDASDAGSIVDASKPDAADAAPVECTVKPSVLVCGANTPQCISGPTTNCLQPCPGGFQPWDCQGPCGGGKTCCAPAATVTGVSAHSCNQGQISVDENGAIGSQCAAKCAANVPILCYLNSDCPAGQACVEAKITVGPLALQNEVMGVCAP